MRLCALAIVVLIACSPQSMSPRTTPPVEPSRQVATPTPLTFTVPPEAVATDGGCGQTTVHSGPVSGSLATATGNNVPPTPYAIARPPIAAAFLFGHPLHGPGSDLSNANKILWVVGTARTGPLLVDGRPLGKSGPTVGFSFPANSGPGEIYPSGVDVPESGCWQFTLQWAGQTAEIELAYR